MRKNRKLTGIILSTLIMVMLIVYMGPVDGFTHGYYVDEINCDQIAAEDFMDTISLEPAGYEMVFAPQKAHMNGFEIYLVNQSDGNTGNLVLTVLDDATVIDTIRVDLSKVPNASWYKVYTSCKLKRGHEYVLRFSTDNCQVAPCLQNVSTDYLPDESLSGNVLISYAYAEPTFTLQNKIVIVMFLVAIWMFIVGFNTNERIRQYIHIMAGFLFMTTLLTWNYMYNSMDDQNEKFINFQADSETLVTSVIYDDRNGESFRGDDEQGFGLGRYFDLKGCLDRYGLSYKTDDDWLNGYSRTEGAIVVNSNIYSQEVAIPGNYILFANGDSFQITDVDYYKYKDSDIVIYLNSGHELTSAKNGSLDDAVFYDSNNNQLARSRITAYKSQYGFQGKFFRYIARFMEDDQAIATLNLICSIATALVFVMIVYLISLKYNRILAGCFLITFWLSPWIVNFARNLYWVEFTWFIPMAIGLFCAWKINSRKCRIASYILTLITITGKCLCGYEYISVVMMGLIAFLLVDLVLAFISKDRHQSVLLLRTSVIIGIMALIGFAIAICIHAPLRGNGNLIAGIKDIIEQDVMRRTNGSDLNNFDAASWPSLNASVWEVFCMYFHFSTEVIMGISGNLFPAICIIPLCIFGYEYKMKKLNVELLSMYIVFFLTSISWFCLAKAHSYIHTHMNYVLWYFGYVQICLYIIVNKIVEVFRKGNVVFEREPLRK